jgi:hypothetical protein
MSNDFDNVLERAKFAVEKGVAIVKVVEAPYTHDAMDHEGPGRGRPYEVTRGTHAVELTISWKETQP